MKLDGCSADTKTSYDSVSNIDNGSDKVGVRYSYIDSDQVYDTIKTVNYRHIQIIFFYVNAIVQSKKFLNYFIFYRLWSLFFVCRVFRAFGLINIFAAQIH